MKKMITLFWILTVLLSAVMVSAQVQEAKHKVELEDPVDDVRISNGKPGMDIVKMAMATDGQDFHVEVILKETIDTYLREGMAGDVLEMHFDTDNDQTTGGKPFWGKREGFEFLVSLVACIRYENGGLACMGGLGDEIEGFCTSYKTKAYEQGSKSTKDLRSSLESTQKDIVGKRIELVFPYTEIGVKPGQKVRIALRESDSSFNDDSYFPEILLTLK